MHSVHLWLSLWAAWPCYPLELPGSGARHPSFATLPSKPLVMVALAPTVAACAHSRTLAQSLSRPIYLTQTSASRPSPAYLSSSCFSLGVSNRPVPLHPGSHNEMKGREPLCWETRVVSMRVTILICQAICWSNKNNGRKKTVVGELGSLSNINMFS